MSFYLEEHPDLLVDLLKVPHRSLVASHQLAQTADAHVSSAVAR